MPNVQVRTSTPLDQQQIEKLQAGICGSISLIPGKFEAVTMTEIVPNCNLYLGGIGDGDCAYVDILVNNEPETDALLAYSKRVSAIISDVTGIDIRRIYLLHRSVPKWHAGAMFAE